MVQPGDMIIAVNKQSAASDHMLAMIQSAGRGEEVSLLIDPGPENFDVGSTKFGTPTVRDWSQPIPVNNFSMYAKRSRYPELKPHFATLDISESSSDEAIRRHYKRLCRLWHPDKNPGIIKQAKEKIQVINEAYNAIKLKLHL